MKIQGVVFDFNGTLFWDTDLQNASWDAYSRMHDVVLSDKEKEEYIHGRNSKDTLEYIFKRELSRPELERFTEEKEALYRKKCEKTDMKLAPGALSLLQYLKEHNIRPAIATAAGKSNVDFYIEKFDLLNYFNKEHIVYNDGTVRGKPAPDLFIRALDRLQVAPEQAIIFEDSKSGIEAAKRANVKDVIIVDSNGDGFDLYNFKRITHFDQFDRSVLHNG